MITAIETAETKTFETTIELLVGDECRSCDVRFEMTFENGRAIDIEILSSPADLDERAFDKLTDECWQLGS